QHNLRTLRVNCLGEPGFILYDVGTHIKAVLEERPHHQRGVEGIVFHQQSAQLEFGLGGIDRFELGSSAAHCVCPAAFASPLLTGARLVSIQYSPSNFTTFRKSPKSTGFWM